MSSHVQTVSPVALPVIHGVAHNGTSVTPQPDYLKQDVANLTRSITHPTQETRQGFRRFLGFITEALTWGVFFEWGEKLAGVVLALFKHLFENLGDVLGGLFN
jgi:hypothetical protein